MVTVVGDNIDTCEITWHDGTTPISKDDIKAQLPTALNIALDDIRIQRNGLIKDNVRILDNCIIGKHGFGFFPTQNKN